MESKGEAKQTQVWESVESGGGGSPYFFDLLQENQIYRAHGPMLNNNVLCIVCLHSIAV